MYKCILIDDDYWALLDMRTSFPFQQYHFELIGEYHNAEDALMGIMNLNPDLVITDMCMEISSGVDLLQICRKNGIDIPFLMVSGHDTFSYVQDALNNGAIYYMLKPISPEDAHHALAKAKKLLDERTVVNTDLSSFEKVLTYIQLHYSEHFSLEDLASEFGFNKTYLSELFAKQMGMGFVQYKNTLRITKAKELLTKGRTIQEVSSYVGFDDPHYFSRGYKKITGEPPIQQKTSDRNG